MVIALVLFWMSFCNIISGGGIWNFVQLHCLLNFIAIFWKFKIQPLFLGKFLGRGVPREIVSRATLGTRAIGSPPLFYIDSNPGLVSLTLSYPGSSPTFHLVPLLLISMASNLLSLNFSTAFLVLYSSYSIQTPLSSIKSQSSVNHKVYADDTQLFLSF